MSERFRNRLAILPRAAINGLTTLGRRHRPAQPNRILIAHHLLLGDTLMLTALIARLREQFPRAEIVMTVSPDYLPLYAGAPYGVKAVPWDPRAAKSFSALQRTSNGVTAESQFDLAFVPGDNRHALLARALHSCWIIALAGDRPGWKNRIVDELVPAPRTAISLADMFASLAGGADDLAFDPRAWPAPEFKPFAMPQAPYAMLHVGAGSALRLWEAEKWRAVAAHFSSRGLHIVWSAGPGEESLVDAIAGSVQGRTDTNFAGKLDLSQLWHLTAGARILVALDSGIAHLAKHTVTPTVCLYGPGSATLFGTGLFWRNAPFVGVTIDNFHCRDQTTVFKRDMSWVRRCQRVPGAQMTATTCPAAACMQAIDVASVIAAADTLLAGGKK